MVVDTTFVISRTPATTAAPAVETLLRDDRIPVMQHGQWTFLSQEQVAELRKRDDVGTAVTTAAPEAPTHGTATGTGTEATKTSKTTSSSPLPSIFDSSLASNFSADSACPAFINSFLTNPTFKKCYPFSLLLQVRPFFSLLLAASCA